MWPEQAIIVIAAHDLYCCLLPQCEALRTCRSGFPIATHSSAGVGNLRPAWTFDMARMKIFVTLVRVQRRVKTKLHDKQVLRQEVKRSHSSSHG